MTRDQRIVATGAATGVAFMILVIFGLYAWLPAPVLPDLADRLGYALQALAFAALPLLASVIAVGNSRFLSEAIDPTRHAESRAMEIDGRVVDNNLQQFVLFAVATLALTVSLPSREMGLIAAAAAVFVVIRIAFWIGYRIDPLYRAFGMSSTIYLNLGLLVAAIWRAVS